MNRPSLPRVAGFHVASALIVSDRLDFEGNAEYSVEFYKPPVAQPISNDAEMLGMVARYRDINNYISLEWHPKESML